MYENKKRNKKIMDIQTCTWVYSYQRIERLKWKWKTLKKLKKIFTLLYVTIFFLQMVWNQISDHH